MPLGRLLLGAARESSARVCGRLRGRGHQVRFAHSALITNLDREGTRLTVLAERAEMSKQAMGVLARELEDAGYVERAVDPTDARAVLLTPTQRGYELINDMAKEMAQVEDELRVLFGEAELQTLRRCLSVLLREAQSGIALKAQV
jgi:DNA-binding MarR family transcriptional regulator